jgi:hypothetical protein
VSAPAPNPEPRNAGAGRPCPACGEPLYGWIKVGAADPRSEQSYVVDRCERCGLGVTRDLPREDPTVAGARSRAEEGDGGEIRVPNRDSLQAGLGGDRWAALDLPAQGLHPTPRSLGPLLERQGLEATRVRQPPFGRNQLWMWQTLLNGFTFHTNFARAAVAGRLTPGTARNPAAYAIDALVSILAALPVAAVAVPLELLAVLARRGGEMIVSVRAATPRATSGARSAGAGAASS